MTTNMTRRSVALAGPAALALGTIGPVATLATLGGMPTPANAQTISNGTPNIEEFIIFYKQKFEPYASKVGQRALAFQYTLKYLAGNANIPTGSTQWFSIYESFAAKVVDATVGESYYNSFSATEKDQVRARNRLWLHDETPDARLNLPARTFTSLQVVNFNHFIYNLTVDHVSRIKIQNARRWHLLEAFVYVSAPSSYFTVLSQKSIEAERQQNVRYLRGNTADSLKPIKDYLGRILSWVPSFGNTRKAIERVELVNNRDPYAASVYKPSYLARNAINHGLNSTTKEPKEIINATDYWTSDAYNLTYNQTDGIDYYVNQDIAQNGPFKDMNIEQSKRMLRSVTIFVSKETGLVYESYIIAQYYVRAFQQLTVAVVRFFLQKGGLLDLARLRTELVETVTMADLEARFALEPYQAAMDGALSMLFIETMAGVVFMALAIRESNDAVNANKGKNTTAYEDRILAQERLMLRSTLSNSAASIAAIGLLGVAAYGPGDSSVFVKKMSANIAASAFVVSDYTASINMWVEVFRSGTQHTLEGQLKLTIGALRMSGAVYTTLEFGYKLWNKTFVGFGVTLTPLRYTSATAALAGCFYFALAVLTSA